MLALVMPWVVVAIGTLRQGRAQACRHVRGDDKDDLTHKASETFVSRCSPRCKQYLEEEVGRAGESPDLNRSWRDDDAGRVQGVVILDLPGRSCKRFVDFRCLSDVVLYSGFFIVGPLGSLAKTCDDSKHQNI